VRIRIRKVLTCFQGSLIFYLCVGLPYLVMELEAFANNKALDGALKQVKLIAPETPTIFFSGELQTH
jgi:hypothetical protein